MPRNTVYLCAASRTQDLLNIKWTLRSAGYAIGSTWHEGEATTSRLGVTDHWNASSAEQLKACDLWIVLCGIKGELTPELAMIAGFALAEGLRVIWIGDAVPGLTDFQAVQQFNMAEDFRTQILQQMYSQPISMDERLPA